MEYEVKTVGSVDWDNIPKAVIDSYRWGRDYTPEAYAQLAYIAGKGFALKMTCLESTPKAVYEHYGDPVYKDSAMEFFASFDASSPLYMNFEMNSNGAFLSAVRKSRKEKTPIDRIVDISEIIIKNTVLPAQWSVEVFFSVNIVEKLFGVREFPKGYRFKGNFYKCGDETAVPHFGSWAPIDLPEPDFHCPAYFGDLVIG